MLLFLPGYLGIFLRFLIDFGLNVFLQTFLILFGCSPHRYSVLAACKPLPVLVRRRKRRRRRWKVKSLVNTCWNFLSLTYYFTTSDLSLTLISLLISPNYLSLFIQWWLEWKMNTSHRNYKTNVRFIENIFLS